METETFLRRVKIRNYKSIGKCDIAPGRRTILVGRNGSGKSNFLDALRFLEDGLQTSLDHAIKSRGGIDEVRRRSTGHPHNFGIEVEMNLPKFHMASYGFEVSSQPKGGFLVKSEKLDVWRPDGSKLARFRLTNGEIEDSSIENMPKAAKDRLYLVTASGMAEFGDSYDALLSMGFYNLSPEQMKEVHGPDAGELLRRDGSNIASVVARLAEDDPGIKTRIRDYLAAIVPDIVDFDRVPLGHRETLEFRQQVKGSQHPWRFYAANMSDGTLRTLGVLVAAMQLVNRKNRVRLVGIEEPESALHPAAAGALMDSLREAATNTQVLLTSQGPDLVDRFEPDKDELVVVQAAQGATELGPADPASLESIRNHLYSAGDLLRMDQLQPDKLALSKQKELVFD
jgi:predicted ATPase